MVSIHLSSEIDVLEHLLVVLDSTGVQQQAVVFISFLPGRYEHLNKASTKLPPLMIINLLYDHA